MDKQSIPNNEQRNRAVNSCKTYSVSGRDEMTPEELVAHIRDLIQEVMRK